MTDAGVHGSTGPDQKSGPARVRLTPAELRRGLVDYGIALSSQQIKVALSQGAPALSCAEFALWWESNGAGDGPDDDNALARERFRLVREQRKKLERENRIGDGAVISREIVRASVNGAMAALFGALDRIFLSELPATVCGLEPSAIKDCNHRAIERLKDDFRSALTAMVESPTKIRRKVGRPRKAG